MDLRASLDQILRAKEPFGVAFYEILFERFPETKAFFQETDLKRQQVVLTMAVSVIGQHYLHRYPATQKYLAYLGTHHHDRGIPERLLPAFRDALLLTLARTLGPQWSEVLEREWREAIELASREMGTGYSSRITI
jgi:hemoglobin-like flavoprotein